MKYIVSGLLGFLFTLLLSVPLQMVMKQREAKASVSMKAKILKEAELDVSVPPMVQIGNKVDSKEPKIKFMPQYPAEAAAKQIEGYVTLSFTVSREGSVQNLKIVDSSPPQVFDDAARAAVSKWTFPGKSSSEAQSLRLNFNFNRNIAAEQRGESI